MAVEESPYDVQLVGQAIRTQRSATAATVQARELTLEINALRREVAELRGVFGRRREKPAAEETAVEADVPIADEPLADSPTGDEPVADEPVADEPVVDGPPVVVTPPAAAPPAESDTLSQWSWNLLQRRCASCHNPATPKGDFVLFETDKVTHKPVTPGMLIMLDQVLYSNEMPKSPKPKLTAAEYNKLRAWIQQYTGGIRQVARAAESQ